MNEGRRQHRIRRDPFFAQCLRERRRRRSITERNDVAARRKQRQAAATVNNSNNNLEEFTEVDFERTQKLTAKFIAIGRGA